jgi:acyl-CoA synthetase (AMP-forming)/AMP-acid ligase II
MSGGLVELVDRRAAEAPDLILLVDEQGSRMTCSGFASETVRVAERLAAAGIGEGVLVSWVLPTAIETLVVMVALARLGAVQNPIIPMYREREIGHILDEAAVDAMIVVPEWRGIDFLSMCTSLAASRGDLPVVSFPALMDPGARAPLPVLGECRDHGRVAPAQWLFYTSGTSGFPKGCRHTDGTLAAAAAGMIDHLAITQQDRSGVAFPIAHVGGAINLMASLLSGATLVLIEHFEAVSSSAVLAREGVTMAGSGTAFHLAYLEVQARHPAEPLFPALRCCPGGGAPKPAGLHERVKRELGGAGIVSSWGLTEAPVLTMGRTTDSDVKLSETEGTPLPGVHLRVVGPDDHPARPGEQGELRVRAPQQMLGYVDSSLDAEVFDTSGYLRTGDLGSVDDDGYVRITGRLKDVVIRKGENVATAELEELLRSHPDVADAAVIGLPDDVAGERVCAVVELVPGAGSIDVTTAGAFLEGKGLRPVAWPERVEIVVALPRTVAGKIDKARLRESYAD